MTVPEITYTIILIVAIVILITLYILGLIRSLRAGSTGRRAAIPALTLGFLLCVYLVFNVREIGPTDWAQIVLLFGLVVVTGVYAMSTARQADASVKMAKQMVKPRLTPDLYLEGSFFEGRRVKFNAMVNNDGEGSAYDVELWIEDDSTPPSKLITGGHKIAVLRRGDSRHWLVPSPYLDFPHSDKVQRRFFVVKYRDVNGEYEIRQPFVLETAEGDKPYARLESISRKIIRKINLEDELP